MPVGGKLVFKGGDTLQVAAGVQKKKSNKKAKAVDGEDAATAAVVPSEPVDPKQPKKADPLAVSTNGNTYEKEFAFEEQRALEPKVKNTPWGSSYRAAPEILHGYDRKVTGVDAQERLDLRCARKADKFCK